VRLILNLITEQLIFGQCSPREVLTVNRLFLLFRLVELSLSEALYIPSMLRRWLSKLHDHICSLLFTRWFWL